MKPLLALKASAGSGKTTRLVGRYLELLANNAKPNEILCLTFTNKAADEMRERVLAALENPKQALQKLGVDVQNINEDALKEFAQDVKDAPILTFDGFFNRVLKAFCFYAEVPFKYEVTPQDIEPEEFLELLSELERYKLAKFLKTYDASIDSLMKNFASMFELPNLQTPNVKFYDDAKATQKATIIKNEVLKSESQSAIKAVSFQTVEELLDKGKTWLCKDELSEYSFFKKINFSQEAKEAFMALKITLKERFEARESIYLNRLDKWFDAYKTAKKHRFSARRVCTYSEITREVWKLLRQDGQVSSDFLYFRLDGKITHVLIDEFQDTNRLQYDVLWPIINEIVSGEGRRNGRTFFYVGDPKQSIYRFRGGVSALFDELSGSIDGVSVEELDKGYRLCEEITNFVNEVFSPLFVNYKNQLIGKPIEQSGGYVEVCEDDDVVNACVKKTLELLSHNVLPSQIAVLCHKNDECEQIADALTEKGVLIRREASAKTVNQPNAKAIIEWIKFCVFGCELNGYNALKLFGEDLNQKPIAQKISVTTNAQSAVFAVMKRFNAFEQDAFALLELSANYIDAYDLAYNIEKNEASFEGRKNEGVRILTVHKSKGLEFDYVILADKTSAPSASRGATFTQYDGSKPIRLWLKESVRENLDEEYKKAKELNKQEDVNDARNALYVAFTRAKAGLIAIKKQEKSALEILNLAPLKLGRIKTSDNLSSCEQKQEAYKGAIWVDFGRQEVKNATSKQNSPSIQIGVATHLAMEFYRANMNEAEYEAILRAKINDENVIKEALQNAKLTNLNLEALIKDKQIYKEIGFKVEGNIGRIDLLAIKDDKDALIVDFKSGTSKDEAYKNQLGFYEYAVLKLLNIKAKRAVLRVDGTSFI